MCRFSKIEKRAKSLHPTGESQRLNKAATSFKHYFKPLFTVNCIGVKNVVALSLSTTSFTVGLERICPFAIFENRHDAVCI